MISTTTNVKSKATVPKTRHGYRGCRTTAGQDPIPYFHGVPNFGRLRFGQLGQQGDGVDSEFKS